jgi:hypothetical protein
VAKVIKDVQGLPQAEAVEMLESAVVIDEGEVALEPIPIGYTAPV